MKAAHNGVINFSVLDGWWIEGWIEGVTGWAIGPPPTEKLSNEERKIRELDDLYSKLEYIIAQMYYKSRKKWIETMKNSIGKLAYTQPADPPAPARPARRARLGHRQTGPSSKPPIGQSQR